MEIFIDLAKIAEGQPEQTLPGIDLNLSGLVDFKKPELAPEFIQTQLKTVSDLVLPGFNPIDYFGQIQSEFSKISDALNSPSIKDDTTTFQEAQKNSNTALDSFASYLETRMDKIETLTSNKEEIRQLIQGQSDTRLSDIQSIVNKQLTQTESIEQVTSTNSINTALSSLVDNLTGGGKNPEGPGMVILSDQKTKELVQNQESNINTTTESISRLDETISNFATNVINVANESNSRQPQINQALEEPKRGMLPIAKEIPKPDYAAASLSAMQELVTGVAATNTTLSTSTSQYNTNTTTMVDSGQGQPMGSAMQQSAPGQEGPIILGGTSEGMSSVYLMQMLNLMKSGQLKVKIQ